MEINTQQNVTSRTNQSELIPTCNSMQKTALECHVEKTLPVRSTISSQNACDIQGVKYPELTIGMFFDFMRTAYQVNESFEGLANILTANSEINWNELAKVNFNLPISGDNAAMSNNNCLSNDAKHHDKTVEAINKRLLDSDITSSEKTMEQYTINIENSIENISNEITDRNKLTVGEPCNVSKTKIERTSTRKISDAHNTTKQLMKCNTSDISKQATTRNEMSIKCEIIEMKEDADPQKNVDKGTVLTAKNDVLDETQDIMAKVMKQSLSDILHEGLLDSVLPYMLPKPIASQPVIKKTHSNTDVKKCCSLTNNGEHRTVGSMLNFKERDKDKNKSTKKSLETEVEIHVCDEGKSIKKDFRCPQKLLIQKMCYFADVTAGQKLEEIDISVHCDIVIFDWLMRWVKKDIIKKTEWPILEAGNVIPVMVSASFLQMEPLLEECLEYCHTNMSDILRTSVLTCLDDILLTRLAKLFSNEEVEGLKDKKDKIQSRLFCKLIMSLAEPIPDHRKGHHSSLATLFKCGKCGKKVIQSISELVPCISSSMKIDNKGNIYNKHVRDLMWSLNEYIVALRSETRSWRKVYWRLWGDCHFLFCQQCNIYFPVHQMNWCTFHPESPQFFVNEQQRPTPFPLGRYPCCSQRAYRFEVLPNREGCKYREHIPEVKTENDLSILNIFTANREVISMDPPQLFFPEKITRLVARDPSLRPGKLMCKEAMWWNGIELVPPRPKLGLLGKIWGGMTLRRPAQLQDAQKSLPKNRQERPVTTDTSSPSTSVTNSDEDDIETGGDETSTDEDSNYSDESNAWASLKPLAKKKKKRVGQNLRRENGRCWNNNLLTRYNQDNQRDFEERAAVQMMMLLTKKTCTDSILLAKSYTKHNQTWKTSQPTGGTYVKLEAEFREQWTQSCKYKNSLPGKSGIRSKTNKHV